MTLATRRKLRHHQQGKPHTHHFHLLATILPTILLSPYTTHLHTITGLLPTFGTACYLLVTHISAGCRRGWERPPLRTRRSLTDWYSSSAVVSIVSKFMVFVFYLNIISCFLYLHKSSYYPSHFYISELL